jgi:ABC-type transporter MlaC component
MANVDERLARLEEGQETLKGDSAYIRNKVDELSMWMNQQKGAADGRKPYVHG